MPMLNELMGWSFNFGFMDYSAYFFSLLVQKFYFIFQLTILGDVWFVNMSSRPYLSSTY